MRSEQKVGARLKKRGEWSHAHCWSMDNSWWLMRSVCWEGQTEGTAFETILSCTSQELAFNFWPNSIYVFWENHDWTLIQKHMIVCQDSILREWILVVPWEWLGYVSFWITTVKSKMVVLKHTFWHFWITTAKSKMFGLEATFSYFWIRTS